MFEKFLEKYIPRYILEKEFLGNSTEQIIIAATIFLALVILFKIFKTVIFIRIKTFAEKTPGRFFNRLVEAFEKIGAGFYDLVALYFAVSSLALPERVRTVLDAFLLALIILQSISSAQIIIRYFLEKLLSSNRSVQDVTAMNGLMLLINIVLYSLAALMIVSNLGVNVTSLVASLGIGGIAVALAAQNILADLFSSFSIYFDKPFEVGDFIVIGDKKGNVKTIGLKTTRIESLDGEEIVMSNQELTKSTIHNYKKMPRRRVLFTLGVTYATNLEQCKKIPEIVRNVCKELSEAITLDRVNFFEFADSSLNFEVVYFHRNNDYNDYMNFREMLNLRIKEEFQEAGIEMAFPTRTVYIEKED